MTYLDLVYADEILQALISVFTDKMGSWAFAIPGFAILAALYIKTEDTTMPLIVGTLFGIVMVTLLPPEVSKVGYLFLLIGIAAGLMKVRENM